MDNKLKRREQLVDNLDWLIYKVLFLRNEQLKPVRPRISEIVNKTARGHVVVNVEVFLSKYEGYAIEKT